MSQALSPRAGGEYPDLFAHGTDDEHERLQILAQELDEGTIRRLEALQPRPDWRCLEIGAGTGTVARWLARRCPTGQVTASDLSLRYLAQVSGPNLQVIQHDVTTDDFPAESFDLIVARWVFCHLRSRERDLARVVNWLVPGGWLMLEDPASFPLESSPHPLYRKVFLAMLRGSAELMGTDTGWARTFPEPLARLGLERLGLEGSLLIGGPIILWPQPTTDRGGGAGAVRAVGNRNRKDAKDTKVRKEVLKSFADLCALCAFAVKEQ